MNRLQAWFLGDNRGYTFFNTPQQIPTAEIHASLFELLNASHVQSMGIVAACSSIPIENALGWGGGLKLGKIGKGVIGF